MTVSNLSPGNGERKSVPVVFVKAGQVFTSSRDLAESSGKRHDHILRDIDNLLKDIAPQDWGALFSAVSEFSPAANREVRHFEMTRKGFVLLAMGFTGKEWTAWKLRYIDAFDKMEAELLKRNDPMEQLSDPAKLRGLLLDYAARTEKAERQVAVLTPKADALDRLAETHGEFQRKIVAQGLQVSQRFFSEWLRENKWIHTPSGQRHEILCEDKRKKGFGVLKFERINTGELVPVVHFTPKGVKEIGMALYRDEPAKLWPLLAAMGILPN